MATHRLTNEIIQAAIDGFEAQKKRIDEQIAELRQVTSGESAAVSPEAASPRRKRKKMSAAGRKRIAEAQRKRWAEKKGASGTAAKAAPAKKAKRKLSAEGRKRIIEATKRRWAAVHAAAGKE